GKVPGNVKVNMNLKNPKGKVKHVSSDVPPRMSKKWAKHKGVEVDNNGCMKGQGNNKGNRQSYLPNIDMNMLKASALDVKAFNLIDELSKKLDELSDVINRLGKYIQL
ncbi:hypothetical protein ACFL6I_29045, partial [candidate division KSB1 bacterium]